MTACVLDANKEGTVSSSRPAQNMEPESKTESTPHFQKAKHEKGSGKLEGLEHDVNQLIEVMKKVVKQPGFEFLIGQSQPAFSMKGDVNTADERERLFYDAMMKNWREERLGESQSGGLDEVVVKLKDGVFAIKAKKADGAKRECRSIPEDTKVSCKASPKTREEFLNTVARRGDDSEIIVVGSVDEKLSGEESGSRMDIVEKMVRFDGSLSDPSDDYSHITEKNSRPVEKTVEIPDNTEVPKRRTKMIHAADGKAGDIVVFTDCDPDETPVSKVNEGENNVQDNIDITDHREPDNSENSDHVLEPESVSVDDATNGKTKEFDTLGKRTGKDAEITYEETFDGDESTQDTSKVTGESTENTAGDRHGGGDQGSDEVSHTGGEGKQETDNGDEKQKESDSVSVNTGKDFNVNSLEKGGKENQGFTQDTFDEFLSNLDDRTRIEDENSQVIHNSLDLNIENNLDNAESMGINADDKHIPGEPPEE